MIKGKLVFPILSGIVTFHLVSLTILNKTEWTTWSIGNFQRMFQVLSVVHPVKVFKFQMLQQQATAIENCKKDGIFETKITFFEGQIHFWLNGTKLHSHRYPSVTLHVDSPRIFIVKIRFQICKISHYCT